jgi:hypothetical protein
MKSKLILALLSLSIIVALPGLADARGGGGGGGGGGHGGGGGGGGFHGGGGGFGGGFVHPGGFGRFAAGRPFGFRGDRFAFRNRFAFSGRVFPYGYADGCYGRVWTPWGWSWRSVCY